MKHDVSHESNYKIKNYDVICNNSINKAEVCVARV